MGPPDRLKKNAPAPEIKTQKSSMSSLVHQCSVGTCWFIGCLGTVRCLGWVLWIVVSLWRRWWDMMEHDGTWMLKIQSSKQHPDFQETTATGRIPHDMFSLYAKELSTFNSLVSSQKGFFQHPKTSTKTFRVGTKKNWKNKKNSKKCLVSSFFQIDWNFLNSPKLTIKVTLVTLQGLIGDYAWDKAREILPEWWPSQKESATDWFIQHNE